MTLKTRDDFDSDQELCDYINQIQIEKNAKAEAEALAREGE